MERRALMPDANILIRAVLGQRVRHILKFHTDNISFIVREAAYAEAQEHLAALLVKRGGNPLTALAVLEAIAEAEHAAVFEISPTSPTSRHDRGGLAGR